MQKSLLLVYFCCYYTFIWGQTYSLDASFLDQIKIDNSLAKSVKVLHIEEYNTLVKDQPTPSYQELQKLTNLKELVFQDWVYGARRDTQIFFDTETSEQLTTIVDVKEKISTTKIIELLGAYKDLEVLSLSFQNQTDWLAMKAHYRDAIYNALIGDLAPCLQHKQQISISSNQTKDYILCELAINPEQANVHHLFEKKENLATCLHTDFYKKWMAYFQLEKGIYHQKSFLKTDGEKYLDFFAIDTTLIPNQDLPFISQLHESLNIKKLQFSTLAKKGIRQLGIAGLSPAEQLAIKLRQLPDLRVLKISDYPNLQQDLPLLLKALEQLPQLEMLSITNCQLRYIPRELANLKQLKILDLSNNELNIVGPYLYNLEQLERLVLDHNPIEHYDTTFYQLPKIKELYLEYCPSPPPLLGLLKSLEFLSLKHTPVTSSLALSRELQKLQLLQTLNLEATSLSKWPQSIQYLRNLKLLHLEHNQFYQWPSNLSHWPKMNIYVDHNFLPPPSMVSKAKLLGYANKNDSITASFIDYRNQKLKNPVLAVVPALKNLFCLSKHKSVYLAAKSWQAREKDFDFSGTLFFPSLKIDTKDAKFHYQEYKVSLLNIQDAQLLLPYSKRNSLGQRTKYQYTYKEKIPFPISDVVMEIILDEPFHKLCQWLPNEAYPLLKTRDTSYIYSSHYDSSKFYLKLPPFELHHLHQLNIEDILINAIFCANNIVADQPVKVQLLDPYLTFGFQKAAERMPLYIKNHKNGLLQLDGLLEWRPNGLLAKGKLSTLQWSAEADYIYLQEDYLVIHAQKFKSKAGDIQRNIQLLYYPYTEELIIQDGTLPFLLWATEGDEINIKDEVLYWPVKYTKGEHRLELSRVQKASTHQFQSIGQFDVYCYFPQELAEVILMDFDALVFLEQIESEVAAFTFTNVEMNWLPQARQLLAYSGQTLSTKIYLNAIFDHTIDQPVSALLKISPQAPFDIFEWYFENKNGNWYYFRLEDKHLRISSNSPKYLSTWQTLKKKRRHQKVKGRRFSIQFISQEFVDFFLRKNHP